jgi:hypothetical protein
VAQDECPEFKPQYHKKKKKGFGEDLRFNALMHIEGSEICLAYSKCLISV